MHEAQYPSYNFIKVMGTEAVKIDKVAGKSDLLYRLKIVNQFT